MAFRKFLRLRFALIMAGLAPYPVSIGFAAPPGDASMSNAAPNAAAANDGTMTCTNPASGASWQIKIDYLRGTVDSNPAHIGATEISWHDAKDGGNYTLDRTSGNLTVIVPSSTGGYFLYDHCQTKQ